MRGLLFLLAWLPASAFGQEWITPEVCRVDHPAVHEDVLEPPGLEALRAEAAKRANPVGRLWAITTADGATSHLWGTMHSSDRPILDLPEILVETIQSARLVAVEIDYVFPDRASLLASFEFEGWFREGPTLGAPFSLVPDADPRIETWIRARTEDLGYGPDAPDFLTFGGLAELILADPCEDFSAGVLPTQDSYIQTLAHIAGVPILGLEAPGDMVEYLSEPDHEHIGRALVSVYGAYFEPVPDNRQRSTSLALYLRGETALLDAWDAAFLRTRLGDDAAHWIGLANGYLVDYRNDLFLDAARAEIAQGGVLIAVGAAHLPGDMGLIELLRAEGHTVTRVPVAGEVAE